jgi:hypothetical protein
LGIEKGSFAGRCALQAGVFVHMAPRNGPCKAQLAGFQRFPHGLRQFAGKITQSIPVVKYRFGQWPSRQGGARGNCSFYILLCMFNGFAFARPFCQAIKVSLTGVEF